MDSAVRPAVLANWIINDYRALLREGCEPYADHPFRALAVMGLIARWETDSQLARRCLRAVVRGEMDWLWA